MRLGTADICDRYQDDIQVVSPIFKSYGGCSSVGASIETLKINCNDSAFSETLKQPGKGRVLCVDAGADQYAVLDHKMASTAVRNDWRGIIVNGYIRHSAHIKSLPLVVYALGSYPMKGTEKNEAQPDVALSFHGLTIEPGMQVYADEDGVLLSPRAFPEFHYDFNVSFSY